MAAPGLCCCMRAFSSCGERGYSSRWCLASHCRGFSLQSTGLRCTGFSSCSPRALVVVMHRLSCSAAWGIFWDQGSNLCPLHWQAEFHPLDHQGSPGLYLSGEITWAWNFVWKRTEGNILKLDGLDILWLKSHNSRVFLKVWYEEGPLSNDIYIHRKNLMVWG